MTGPRSFRLPLLALAAVALASLAAIGVAQTTDTATPLIDADQLIDRVARGDEVLILDVRSVEEFAAGHVPGALNIPHTEVADRLEEIAAYGDIEIVLYCRSGRRAGMAADVLRGEGFERLLHLEGDMLGWQARQLPVVREPGS
jgi:rhodanese-related sulfurtransferase